MRLYASELKSRSETLYAEAGKDFPEHLANAPASLQETDFLEKSKLTYYENVSVVLRGEVDQL